MKVWDQARIELETPGSAVRHISAARHVTDCATRPSTIAVDWKNKKTQTKQKPANSLGHMEMEQQPA